MTLVRLTSAALLLMLMLSGCSEPLPTVAEEHDQQIETSWMVDRAATDAVEFLEQGGMYENASTDQDIDGQYVLPMIRQLRDDFGLDVRALLDDPEIAFAIVVDVSQMPLGDDRRPQVMDIIEETDKKFPGVLIDKWGDRWLSFDLLDEQEMEVFPQETLDNLKRLIAADRVANRG